MYDLGLFRFVNCVGNVFFIVLEGWYDIEFFVLLGIGVNCFVIDYDCWLI